jgi:pimeloyl-ACP methyl ester carboxylesterase
MPIASSLPTFHQRFTEVGGIRIHYAEVPADRPPLLMIHGIGMDWRVWQAVSRRLSPLFHLYLADLRGHGGSDKPARGYSLAHYAADVEDFIDHLDLAPIVLVGSSLGGMVAATVEAPTDVVTHRVLVDPPITGGGIRDAPMFREILRLKHEPTPRLADYLAQYNPKAGRFYLRIMAEMWHEASDGVIEDMLERPDDYYAIDQSLRLIEAPTLLMRANPELGGVLSSSEAERALRLLPRGTLMDFPDSGHAIHAYQPSEFVRAISGFVGHSFAPDDLTRTRM